MAERSGAPPAGRDPQTPTGVLEAEELRALLSPVPGEGTGDPILLLAPRPEDIAALSAHLADAGFPTAQAVNCFAALDQLRARPHRGLVAWTSALPADLEWYLTRVREIDPALRLCAVQDRAEPPLPDRLPRVEPGRDGKALPALLACLGLAPPQGRSGRGEAPEAGRDLLEEAAPESRGSVAPRPDPFLAVRALLEARLSGKPVEEGLLRWARQDPGLRGWVHKDLENGGRRLRAAADPGEDRRDMVRGLLDQLAGSSPAPREPAAFGPFAVFPHSPPNEGSWAAVWHWDPGAAEGTVRGLHPLLPLFREIEPRPDRGNRDEARNRLASLLASRMRGAERRRGRLGLLLFEAGGEEEAGRLGKVLRALLRGGDWVEPIDRRVYAILEEPDRRVFTALGNRLRDLPGIDRLRAVALGWTPLEGTAEDLLGRAEKILAAGGQGEALPGVTG